MAPETETAPDTGHDYDGIRELDNHLPNWWLATLIIAIIFGYGYWGYYHLIHGDNAIRTEYQADLDSAAAASVARARLAGVITDDTMDAMTHDVKLVAKGAATFKQSCVICHGADGQGVIGPNLTDDYWLHGGRPTDILHTITAGVASKGMPSWGPSLGDENVQAVAAYVLTLKGKHVPGKAPQGDLMAALPATH